MSLLAKTLFDFFSSIAKFPKMSRPHVAGNRCALRFLRLKRPADQDGKMRHECSSDENQIGTPLLFFRKKMGAGCFVSTQSATHITGAGDNVPGEGYGSEQPPFLIRRRTSPPQYDGTKSSSVTGTPERIFFTT